MIQSLAAKNWWENIITFIERWVTNLRVRRLVVGCSSSLSRRSGSGVGLLASIMIPKANNLLPTFYTARCFYNKSRPGQIYPASRDSYKLLTFCHPTTPGVPLVFWRLRFDLVPGEGVEGDPHVTITPWPWVWPWQTTFREFWRAEGSRPMAAVLIRQRDAMPEVSRPWSSTACSETGQKPLTTSSW